MHAGKSLLKIMSVLLILYGSVVTVISIIEMANGGRLSGAHIGPFLSAVVVILIMSILALVLGVIGLKKCEEIRSASYFIISGVVLSGIAAISLALSFQVVSLIGLALPLFYIAGGAMLRHTVMTA